MAESRDLLSPAPAIKH